MDVRFTLFLVLFVVIMFVAGALGYALTGGNMKFVAGTLNYITAPWALIFAGWVAFFALPCECQPTRCAAK